MTRRVRSAPSTPSTPSLQRTRALLTALILTGALAVPTRLGAQESDHVNLRWWHPVVATAGIATLFAIDEPVRDWVQDHRSATLDDIADAATRFHAPEVFLVAGGGAMSLGLLVREPAVAQTGLQIIAAYGLSSGMMIGTKWALGRSRPNATPEDQVDMDLFHGGADSSLPSGASAVVFSLATTVADAVDRPAVTIALYTGATVNAWSRVHGDRHWVSDVTLGALYGITAAKLVNGRWRVFGVRPPTVGIAPDGRRTVGYEIEF